ncbi:DUF4350 domain-containing protein [Calothrix rhizosoleniae]|uniref:DUF4350 domain-containing protein n=1 Tax=Calothrix rhizosoleniae TaxID=888997 RepID=UPI000B49FA5C|nr:DUF4350 domain-containing protein [Calothrix rhizosoleniae]
MKRSNRWLWLSGLILAVILLTMIAAPSSSKLNSGSTYGRAPDGYGAWYAFIQKQGATIQRWKKPFADLTTEKRPVTLLQVRASLGFQALSSKQKKWVETGNNLVILGVYQGVSGAKFSTIQRSLLGDVKIDTSRRREITSGEEADLSDSFGAVVWQKKYGKGKVTFAITPHLAANAYQDYSGNFKYLANLVTHQDNLILVDEYIHGYKDQDVREREGQGNLFSYLGQTPLFPAFMQICVLLLVVVWAKNRRLGKSASLGTPVVDNSAAYIQALAAVLQKAESSDFVVEMVGKEEQMRLQTALGLGKTPLGRDTLIEEWKQQISSDNTELNELLKVQAQKTKIGEKQLIDWLVKWRSLRQILLGENK